MTKLQSQGREPFEAVDRAPEAQADGFATVRQAHESEMAEDYVAEFARTLAPAWKADGRPIYGGFFWINGTEGWPVPKDAYIMAGAGGQYTIIIPSHDLVVVKLSHYSGAAASREGLTEALMILMEAVPSNRE